MRKTILLAGLLCVAYASAQQETPEEIEKKRGRVGINTTSPKASLHIQRHTGIPADRPQGVLFPHLTKEQRDAFAKDDLTEGLMIFNTTKKCIDWWNGTQWACTDGNQIDIPTKPIPNLPASVTLDSSQRYIASVYDTNYLNYTTPTAPADLSDNGAGTDPRIDIQGTITTAGLDIEIPVTITNGTNTEIPAYESNPLTIPADKTQDGQSRQVVLTWDKQSVQGENTSIQAKLKAVGGDLKIKKLDVNKGIGNDYKGVLLGSISYPSSKNGSQSNLEIRAIAGIPDKNFSEAAHQFLYLPIEIEVGGKKRIWLNNNLGADYANINKPTFNPGQQARGYNDYKAYGSLFQWGREADGHELMNWTGATSGAPVRSDKDWKSAAALSTYTENCPNGFRLPTNTELEALREEVNKGTSYVKGFEALGLRFPNSGYLKDTNRSLYDKNNRYYLWSLTEVPNKNMATYSLYAQATRIDGISENNSRSYGFPLRCIADTSTDSGSNGGGVTPVPPPPSGGNTQQQNPVPSGVTLASAKKFIVSVNDNQYSPINILGTITTDGVEVFIPAIFTGQTSPQISTFSKEFSIGADKTKDNQPHTVVLSWESQTVQANNSYVRAKVKAKDRNFEIKQQAIGQNNTGVSLGSITYPSSSTNISGATLELFAIAGIPDKKFNDPNNPNHQFIYHPIEITVGGEKQIWLNNNLGADYANVHSEHFNPAQQATSEKDMNAYGSLFQWGREADGHELIDWRTQSPVYPQMEWLSSDKLPDTGLNNCPTGFRLPNKIEFDRLVNAIGSNTGLNKNFNALGLKIPFASDRSKDNGSLGTLWTGSYLWSSTSITGTEAHIFISNNRDVRSSKNDRSYGYSLRCIKDTPAPKEYTATVIWGDDPNEKIEVANSNCSICKYTYGGGNREGFHTYTAESDISQADAARKATAKMNDPAERAARQKAAQDFVDHYSKCPRPGETLCVWLI